MPTEQIKGLGAICSKSYKAEKYPPMYLYIYYKLRQRAHKIHTEPYLSTEEVLQVMRRIFRAPRKLNYPTLYDLQARGLIKKLNHQTFYINTTKAMNPIIKKILPYIESENYGFW